MLRLFGFTAGRLTRAAAGGPARSCTAVSRPIRIGAPAHPLRPGMVRRQHITDGDRSAGPQRLQCASQVNLCRVPRPVIAQRDAERSAARQAAEPRHRTVRYSNHETRTVLAFSIREYSSCRIAIADAAVALSGTSLSSFHPVSSPRGFTIITIPSRRASRFRPW
jgi:hypothetical protein